jgi:hypothetical protein
VSQRRKDKIGIFIETLMSSLKWAWLGLGEDHGLKLVDTVRQGF